MFQAWKKANVVSFRRFNVMDILPTSEACRLAVRRYVIDCSSITRRDCQRPDNKPVLAVKLGSYAY